MGELVKFPTVKKSEPYVWKVYAVICGFCQHRWELTASMVNTGLWVTQCPECKSFQSDLWHREMFGKG